MAHKFFENFFFLYNIYGILSKGCRNSYGILSFFQPTLMSMPNLGTSQPEGRTSRWCLVC